MNKANKNESIDCIELKHKIQEKIYDEIKNFNRQQEIDYFNNKAKTGKFKHLVTVTKKYTEMVEV